jgi:hypothetical protein
MKNLKLLSVLVALFALAVVGCKKGDTGPKGDTGAAGPAGPDSILYSAWISLNTPFNSTDSLYEQAITATGLTSAILSKGVVESYVGFPNNGDTAVFNIYDPQLQTTNGLFSQILFVGEIDVYATADYTGELYRYVLIPGSVVTNGYKGKVYTKEELRTMTFSQIQKTFNLSSSSTTH